MSNRLNAVKVQFDAMIAQMKEEFCRQVDLKMKILLEMWREEKRLVKMKKEPTCDLAVKRMKKDSVTNISGEDEDGHESEDDNADSVSIKSEIDSDECDCSEEDEDYSNVEVKEEPSDEEGAMAPVASTSRGRKRKATPGRKVIAKRGRVDTERQESASGTGNYKMKTISIDCTMADCQRTFRCGHKMREHLLTVHQVKPFQCRAQGCDQQFDKQGELIYHTRTHSRATATWLCPDCPGKTFANGNSISTHIYDYHLSGQFQCAVGQCQFTSTTRVKVHIHQH